MPGTTAQLRGYLHIFPEGEPGRSALAPPFVENVLPEARPCGSGLGCGGASFRQKLWGVVCGGCPPGGVRTRGRGREGAPRGGFAVGYSSQGWAHIISQQPGRASLALFFQIRKLKGAGKGK